MLHPDDPPEPAPAADPKAHERVRQQRQAVALRENLRRRKQAAKPGQSLLQTAPSRDDARRAADGGQH